MPIKAISEDTFSHLQDLTYVPPKDRQDKNDLVLNRIQRAFYSAILGGASLGVIGGLATGAAAFVISGFSASVAAGTVLPGAIVVGGAGATIAGVRALFCDIPPQEVSIFHSVIAGVFVGHMAALFPDGPFIVGWDIAGGIIGAVEGWAEREIRRKLASALYTHSG